MEVLILYLCVGVVVAACFKALSTDGEAFDIWGHVAVVMVWPILAFIFLVWLIFVKPTQGA